MATVGPYEFSEHDVERTLFNGRTLFDLLPGGLPPDPADPAAPFRADVEAALDARDDLGDQAVLELLWDRWRGAMGALRAAGRFGPRADGQVDGIFWGKGGVPKLPIAEADVGWGGVAGDRHNDRKNHGRPWQALCLWSSEVVAGLAADGHPIGLGSAGENLALSGLPWERVVPGAQLQIGGVRCEVSSYALPCKTNARWFSDGSFDRIHHRHGPVSRVYATVIEPGTVVTGDAAVLEPDALD